MERSIGIIGGGASGMTAAITAAREGAAVTILERGERVGKKILSTGNGKCNLGNLALSAADYHCADPAWLTRVLEQFGTEDTIRFFRSLGMEIHDRNGYLYPLCEQASAVLDVLRYELKSMDVQICTECRVTDIRPSEGGFEVRAGERTFRFDRVILACGGCAAPATGSDGSGYRLARRLGHTVTPTVPTLVQLCCREEYLRGVAGVRALARISACGCSECGELQLTDYGISGIPVFQLSREVNYWLRSAGKGAEAEVRIDLLPNLEPKEFENLCAARESLMRGRSCEEYFTGVVHKKLMLLFLKLCGLKPDAPADKADPERVRAFWRLCRDWRLHVTGSKPYENAQVTAGGVAVAEVSEDMESRIVPGLYLTGELLDADGRCGGYNLHWAWATGYLAGQAAAKE